MDKIDASIQSTLEHMGVNSEPARLNMRVQQVRERYKAAIEAVYHEIAPLHLAHTNNVIIKKERGVRLLIVYVDESLFAAELNAQRELVKLQLLELFGEEIDDFQIKISRWKKYRDMHPYLQEEQEIRHQPTKSIPLDSQENEFVSRTASLVEDERLRRTLKKAMTADLEWKKGERAEIVLKKENEAL